MYDNNYEVIWHHIVQEFSQRHGFVFRIRDDLNDSQNNILTQTIFIRAAAILPKIMSLFRTHLQKMLRWQKHNF